MSTTTTTTNHEKFSQAMIENIEACIQKMDESGRPNTDKLSGIVYLLATGLNDVNSENDERIEAMYNTILNHVFLTGLSASTEDKENEPADLVARLFADDVAKDVLRTLFLQLENPKVLTEDGHNARQAVEHAVNVWVENKIISTDAGASFTLKEDEQKFLITFGVPKIIDVLFEQIIPAVKEVTNKYTLNERVIIWNSLNGTFHDYTEPEFCISAFLSIVKNYLEYNVVSGYNITEDDINTLINKWDYSFTELVVFQIAFHANVLAK